LLDEANKAIDELRKLLDRVKMNWVQLDKRILGHILRSSANALGVGPQRFTEDWGNFLVDKAKLGDGFKGNKIDLGAF
jgi:hypothetical protein